MPTRWLSLSVRGAPEVERLEHAQTAALEEMPDAEIALAQTKPTTLVGVVAIMRYRRELDDGYDGYQLFPDKGMGADPRHEITSWLATIEKSFAVVAQPVVGKVDARPRCQQSEKPEREWPESSGWSGIGAPRNTPTQKPF